VIISLFGVALAANAINAEDGVAPAAFQDSSAAARRNDKRAIGLVDTTGLSYDYTALHHHPVAVAAPVAASTTVVKSAGYHGLPVSAGYTNLGLDRLGYSGIYHPVTTGYTTSYQTGYGGLGYGSGIPVASAAAGYGKLVHPGTTTYQKVVQTYPHLGSTVGAVAPALGYTSLAGYHPAGLLY
ncbi:uncharacterized protein LOC129759157, partial [Uranotaenia lowii]|uniref:uncharacterized protein LOC129759157 n=1 Tax=Uranotaenia lowii TaxID=190385 RepID=UPI00247A83DA